MISRDVEISISGGGGEMVHGLSPRPLFFFSVSFFSFLFISGVVCFRYKKPYAARAMKRKKTINPSIPTARFTSSWEKSSTPNPEEKSPSPST